MHLLFYLVYYHSTCFGPPHNTILMDTQTTLYPDSTYMSVAYDLFTMTQQPITHTSLTKLLLNLQIPLEIGLLHPTRIDTHWWLPLQFCVLLLKMDANRARNA